MKFLHSLLLAPFFLSTLVAEQSAPPTAEQVVTEDVRYSDGDTELQGFVARPEKSDVPLPCVMIVHDWMGLQEYAKIRAGQLAEMGYIAFAIDVYGKDIRPANSEEAAEQAKKYRADTALFRGRLEAALRHVETLPHVDKTKIAAIGYCFGGGAALEMARMGAPLVGVVSFHGSLGTSLPAQAETLKAKILVLHGADDPYVSAEEIRALEQELRQAKADWQFISFGNAVHSFSNRFAGTDTASGNAYDATADRRSWEYMKAFLNEIF